MAPFNDEANIQINKRNYNPTNLVLSLQLYPAWGDCLPV